MARIPDPLYRGTIGNLIFYSVGGRQYVRSKPAKVTQPNTPAQLASRDKFRQSSILAKAISTVAPVLGDDGDHNRTKSAYHTLLGMVRKSRFAEGGSPVRWVWPELKLREGAFPDVDLRGSYNSERKVLELRWNPEKEGEEAGSRLILLLINKERLEAQVYWFDASKAEAELQLSGTWACYACMVSGYNNEAISGVAFVWEGVRG